MLAALNHAHICQLYDLKPNYLVFEFITGAPVKGSFVRSEGVRIGLQIADALEDAHAHGIVYRDLKPGNLWSPNRSQNP